MFFPFGRAEEFPGSLDDGFSTQFGTAYGYFNIRDDDLIWTLGVSVYTYKEKDRDITKLDPKLSVQWNIMPNLRLRLAAFRRVKPPILTNRTIRPTQVAGFNQFFDDVNGTEAWRLGGGIDLRVTRDVSVGIEASQRWLQEHLIALLPNPNGHTVHQDREEQLYWWYIDRPR